MPCYSGKRRLMKLRDKELEKERARERESEKATEAIAEFHNPPSSKIMIEHFSHPHPLVYTASDYPSYSCNICSHRGHGSRYHCAECQYDLDKTCAEAPSTWISTSASGAHRQQLGEVVRTTFAHPEHPLSPDFRQDSFICNHCNHPGKGGLRFVCHTCNLSFHQVCASNPTRLTTHLHEHELELKLRPFNTICTLCGTNGSLISRMYSCKLCGVYLHPGCCEWPLYIVHHPLHPDHPLVLKSCNGKVQRCSACRVPMDGYKYTCGVCCVDFDGGCVQRKAGDQGCLDEEQVRKKYGGADDHQKFRELPAVNLEGASEFSVYHESSPTACVADASLAMIGLTCLALI